MLMLMALGCRSERDGNLISQIGGYHRHCQSGRFPFSYFDGDNFSLPKVLVCAYLCCFNDR